MPERTCISCRSVLEKCSMVRLTAVNGRLEPDLDGKAGGRGGYICSEACLAAACKRKDAFQRALRTRVSECDPAAVWDKVKASRAKGD